ncbi:MAG: ArnT family glycosyltransferase [Candidatus Hodarchaeota archaeon]
MLERYLEYSRSLLDQLFSDRRYQLQLLGYIVVVVLYFLTHLIYFIDYPAFATDEIFYIMKAIWWKKTGQPSVPGWYGDPHLEFTNPPAWSWLLLVMFDFFGTSILVVRLASLTFGICNLVLVFLVSRELGKEEPWRGYLIGIIAGLILTFDVELVEYSRIGYLDNPMNLFLTAFLLFYLQYLKTENINFAWIAGGCAGIGIWFKLTTAVIFVGLGLFTLTNHKIKQRKLDAILRIQAVVAIFVVIYVVWGLSMDPYQFAYENLFQITKTYDADPIGFWAAVLFGRRLGWNQKFIDFFRLFIIFAFLSPIFYFKDHIKRKKDAKFFYEGVYFIFCLTVGIIIFFSSTKSLYDYYLAGVASFYSILLAISFFIMYDIMIFILEKLLVFARQPKNLQDVFREAIQITMIMVVLLSFSIKISGDPLEIQYENQENTEILSYVYENIPKNNTLVAPITIGPWLNASGYSVYTTWFPSSTPDWIVNRYIYNYTLNYLILHNDYSYVLNSTHFGFPNGVLPYYVIYNFPNHDLYMLNSTALKD